MMKTAAKWFLLILGALVSGLMALLLLAATTPAIAQTLTDNPPECLPAPYGSLVDPANPVKGTTMTIGASQNGQWAWWVCWRPDGTHQFVRYLGTRAVRMEYLGYRIDTLLASATPLARAAYLHKRYALVKATDPSLAAVYADYIASLKQ